MRSGEFPVIEPAAAAVHPGRKPRLLSPGAALIAVTYLLGAPLPLDAAQVYKWTDAEGHVHFGDKPPASGAESLTIRSAPAPAANASQQDGLQQMLEDYAREREQRDASRAAIERATEVRTRRCAAARRRQHSVEHANFLYDYDAAGERRVLDGAEYDAAIAQVREAVRYACE